MSPVVKKIPSVSTILGEGPHWDAKTQSLYYVDIMGKSIHKYVPSTNQHSKANIGELVGFIVPVEGSDDRFVIGMGRQVVSLKWDGVSSSVSEIEKIAEVETNLESNRLNDGKADPTGKLWSGSMSIEKDGKIEGTTGSFYSFGKKGQVKKHLSNIKISNGLAWSADLKKFYYIDSGTGSIEQFDFDKDTETISNRQTLFTLAKHNITGFPDGQAIDADGNLWVAVFNGYRVIKIDTKNPETLLGEISLPGKQITSVTFGGANLDELFVTSANITVDGEVLSEADNGVLFHVTDLGVKGLDGDRFRLE